MKTPLSLLLLTGLNAGLTSALPAAELITNGTFDAGESGWTLGYTPDYAGGGVPYYYDSGSTGNGWEVRTSPGAIFGTPLISGPTIYNGWDGGVYASPGGGTPLGEADLTFYLRQPFTKASNYSAADFSFTYDLVGGAYSSQQRTLQAEILSSSLSVVSTLYSFTQPAVGDVPLTTVVLSLLSTLNALPDGNYWIGFREIIPQFYTGPGEIAFDNISFAVTPVPPGPVEVPEAGTWGTLAVLGAAGFAGWRHRRRL